MELQPETLKGCRRNVYHHQMELFDYYAPQMKHICQRYVLHNHAAEEVMLQAFLKAFAKIDHVRDENELYNWLRDKMIVACIDTVFKKNKPSFSIPQITAAAPDKSVAETDWSKIFNCNFSVQELNTVLNSIDAAQSLLFKLFFIENYTVDEIASLVEVEASTCRAIIEASKQSIQAKLYRKYLNE